MALVLKDRVKVTSGVTGTGAATLGAAVTGFQGFAAIGDGNTTYYTIAVQSGTEWEVGIGTVTDIGGGVYTLSRDTILESSNAGAAVNFSAGTKDVFVTYPAERSVYLNSAGSAVDVLDIGTIGAGTANITTANITAGVVTTTPVNATDIANKQYVDDLVVSGIHFHEPVRVETTGNLTATYNNGASGVGATLTNSGTQTALVIDGVAVSVSDRVLVYLQTNQTQNGIYVVTNIGSGSTNWVLTRASDADTYGLASSTKLGEGSAVFVRQGNTGAGETYVCNTTGVITFGTTNITFAQVASAQIYTAGTGLTLTNTTFSITNTGTAGTYGTASQVPVFTTNAQGQVTAVTPTAIAIASSAVSGLAASATTDTTNAANITSGTLNTARINGSYTGITGVGTLAAGTWNANTIAPNYGGTGITGYTVGDIIYADGTTSLAKLAGVATGNALLSGGVGTAPAWGKVGLTTHVSGTLPITNGGTGQTTAGAAINALLPAQTSQSGRYLTTDGTNPSWAAVPAPNNGTLTMNVSGTGLSGSATFTADQAGNSTFTVTSNATSANTNSTIVARDASGSFSAGTITATLNGSAATLTTGRTIGMTGDVTYTSGSFNGSANVTGTATLANSGVTAGSYTVASITVDAKGRVTSASSGAAPSAFPSGTVMLFAQTSAPTGWTKSTAHDNKALRVVSGTAGSGGSVAFTTAFASQVVSGSISSTSAGGTVGDTTLTTTQIPGHTHDGTTGSTSLTGSLDAVAFQSGSSRVASTGIVTNGNGRNANYSGGGGAANTLTTYSINATHTHSFTTGSTGGGGAHNHTFSGTAHSHTFSGTAIDLAVQYVDVIIATKD